MTEPMVAAWAMVSPRLVMHEDEDADDEADRQPAGGREQVEAALGGAWGEVRGHRCSSMPGAWSMSTG